MDISLDWNDVRYFLAVVDTGSTAAAARALGTSQSTVFRRIAQIEAALGIRLFERTPHGYRSTASTAAILPLAREMADVAARFCTTAAEQARRGRTAIRFSAPEIALSLLLPGVVPAFRQHYPAVDLELIATDRMVDLAGGEADVALRATAGSLDPTLFGRRLSHQPSYLTASRGYVATRGLPRDLTDLDGHDFIALPVPSAHPAAVWWDSAIPRARVMMRPDSPSSVLSAVRSGIGFAMLPRFLSDRDPDLIALDVTLPFPPAELWIVTHDRLKTDPAVRGLMDFVAAYVLATDPSYPNSNKVSA